MFGFQVLGIQMVTVVHFVEKYFALYLAVSATDDPLGEGVSRNDPDMDNIVSSLTDDLLLFRVMVSMLANWLRASFRRFRLRPL